MFQSSQYDGQESVRALKELFAYLVILVFISAVWFESDAYRYAALGLLPVTAYYFYYDLLSKDKVLIGYAGFLCLGWAFYVAIRFAYSLIFHIRYGIGSSEGIYLFPLFYPISGYALFMFVPRPIIVVCTFVLTSFLMTLLSFDLSAIIEAHRADVVLQDNPIHAAVAQGMIVLCMLPFTSYLLRNEEMRRDLRDGLIVISIATLLIGLANIYALQSKGVWLALAIALPVELVLIATLRGTRRLILISGFFFVLAVVGVMVAWDGILAVAGHTMEAAEKLLSDMFAGANLLQSMDHAIHDETIPRSFRERLMLWASALLIWMKEPVFGHGVAWMHEWRTRAYPSADYNLLHNGYLEIAIRYGIAGLVFYAVLFSWVIRQVWRARREDVIDPAAFHAYISVFLFFCITIFSNSNIRLAIGESYVWFAAAFGFYCYYQRQKRGLVKVTTWM